jgi:tripartite-type tricarboxylate transporter receptor subunit TctC
MEEEEMKSKYRLVTAFAAAVFAVTASAQSFPTKPVRVVVPFGPGGVADIVARTVAPKISEGLGQQVVVDNRPSAGGIVAAQEVVRAEADGHTLLFITNGNAVSQALFKSLPYDPLNDFSMISTVGFFGLVMLADSAAPYRNMGDVIAAAKASPGRLNLATIGVGSTQNLAAELFKATAGVDLLIVPYKATGEVVTALKNRDANVAFEILAPAMSHIRSGNLRALAVTTAKRFPGLPDVPTAIESGLAGFDVASWNGFAAPAKTPRAVIERLHQEVVKAVAAPEVQQRFLQMGVEGRSMSPEQMREFYLGEAKRWAKVVEDAKIPKQ